MSKKHGSKSADKARMIEIPHPRMLSGCAFQFHLPKSAGEVLFAAKAIRIELPIMPSGTQSTLSNIV
jgi:hypothetical protein